MLVRNSILLTLATEAAARDLPANVKSFYDSVRSKGTCTNKLKSGFHSADRDYGAFSYCGGDHPTEYIYLQGNKGDLANMDIDCDGVQGSSADDGRCGSSSDTQSQTSFQDIVRSYGQGQKDLDANIHPYVVFGNEGSKSGYVTFNPQSYSIQPLSVMAVVCNGKLIYGVWGDTNGDDGAESMIGEASISLATACFGKTVNGNRGHDANDVLYIAFPGPDAVPGKSAKWNARNYDEFEASIQSIGDKLIQRIGASGGGGNNPPPPAGGNNPPPPPGGNNPPPPTGGNNPPPPPGGNNPPPPPGGNNPPPPTGGSCSWAGHCEGASCGSDNDCSDDLTCSSGKCSKGGNTSTTTPPPPATKCSWVGHCEGATCKSGNDCSDDLGCKSGKCSRS